ncbi:MAG: type II secretion system F family protein [Chloroflexi bacterium]|nr:type II secretion system F family protein [Chloroflexota bacterium]
MQNIDPNVLVSVFFALGLATLFLGLDLIISGRRVRLENRIDRYETPRDARENAEGEDKRADRKKDASWRSNLATDLARADLLVTPTEYVFATLVLALVLVVFCLAVLKNPLVAAVGGVAGLISPRMYLQYLQRRRLAAFDRELDGTITMLATTLRTGYGLSQAIEAVAKEVAPPMSTELSRVAREVALGRTVQDALDNLARRNPSLDLSMMITAININHAVGGNLAEVLERIATTIRERVRLMAEIQALTSQQRLSAVVLGVLPFALSLIVYVISPGYISELWKSTCGLALMVTGLFLMAIGYLFIRRLLAFKY